MELSAMFASLGLCVVLLLSFRHGAHGKRHSPPPVIELPPCSEAPGGIQNWDCYDPVSPRHSPSEDIMTDVSHNPVSGADTIPASGEQDVHTQEWLELPPCKFLNSFDHPKTPLPLGEVYYQRAGINCWWPFGPPLYKTNTPSDKNGISDVQSACTQSGTHCPAMVGTPSAVRNSGRYPGHRLLASRSPTCISMMSSCVRSCITSTNLGF